MKIALTAREKNIDTEMDPRFGRAPFFVVYDTEWGSYSFIDNEQNQIGRASCRERVYSNV